MKIKLSKSQWEEMGKKAGWMPEPRECNCGSGKIQEPAYDARGIFLTNVCPKCRSKKLSKYRQDVLENPSYEADEPIEPEAKSVKKIKIAQFEEKMMPGQTSYTDEEKKMRDSLISDSVKAEDKVGINVLDDDNISRRRTVKVTMSDGDTITTGINGTKKEIEDYYLKNWFTKQDENTRTRGIKVDFLA